MKPLRRLLPEFVGQAQVAEQGAGFVERSRAPLAPARIWIPCNAEPPRLFQIEHTAALQAATVEPAIEVLFRPEE
jgi:hypothetical protein